MNTYILVLSSLKMIFFGLVIEDGKGNIYTQEPKKVVTNRFRSKGMFTGTCIFTGVSPEAAMSL